MGHGRNSVWADFIMTNEGLESQDFGENVVLIPKETDLFGLIVNYGGDGTQFNRQFYINTFFNPIVDNYRVNSPEVVLSNNKVELPVTSNDPSGVSSLGVIAAGVYNLNTNIYGPTRNYK